MNAKTICELMCLREWLRPTADQNEVNVEYFKAATGKLMNEPAEGDPEETSG